MKNTADIQIIVNDKTQSVELQLIAQKVHKGERITEGDALTLFEKADLSFVGALANFVREKKHGDATFFNRNFHIEPTNLCIYTCKFCSYSRLIKQRGADSWEYTMDDMMNIIYKYDNEPVTEVHIVGGVLPQYDLPFYLDFFKKIKKHRPEMHVKALTPVEYHYIFKKAKVSYTEGMRLVKEAGCDSLPGGGAEIFHPDIRKIIAHDKCTGEQWLEMHEIWHNLGMRSNATMLYGHIEKYEHRVHHLNELRKLQDKTGGFQTFIPLKFRNKDNEMSNITESTTVEDLKNYAVSRIFLDNFDHIKAYWPMISRPTAQIALSFGVDDLDGTIDDTTKIYSMAGSEEKNPALSTKDLVTMIRRVGRKPIERDTLYNVVTDFENVEFDEEKAFRGYLALPVLN
jgi:aminodeoxyfutalosine synthase